MPATLSADARDRRSAGRCAWPGVLISMASATRSTRSTAITASAVCDATVAPAAPERDADVGQGQGRRVVDAVADHDDGPQRRVRADGCGRRRACRRASGRRRRRRRRAPRRGPRRRPAGRPTPSRRGARRRRAGARPGPPRPGARGRRAPARRRGRRRRRPATRAWPAERPARHPGRAVRSRARRRTPRRRRRRAAPRPRRPRPRPAPRRRSPASASGDPARQRRAHDRLRHDVHGVLLDGRREPQDLVRRRGRPAATTRSSSGCPRVSVPVLSSSTVRVAGELLDDAAALDDHAGTRRSRHARDQRDRRRQDQRARRRDHEDGHRSHRIARHEPADAGEDERRDEHDDRVAVGHAHERRTLLLGVAARAARCRRRCSRWPAGRRAARTPRRRWRVPLRTASPARCSAGSGSPVSADSSSTATLGRERAVDRHHLPRAHHHDVADRELVDRHDLELARGPRRRASVGARSSSAVSARRARRFATASSALPPDSMSATTIGREVLAERERAGHRDQRDQVDADVAPQQRRARRPTASGTSTTATPSGPGDVAGAARAGQVQQRSARQGEGRRPPGASRAPLAHDAPVAARAGSAAAIALGLQLVGDPARPRRRSRPSRGSRRRARGTRTPSRAPRSPGGAGRAGRRTPGGHAPRPPPRARRRPRRARRRGAAARRSARC